MARTCSGLRQRSGPFLKQERECIRARFVKAPVDLQGIGANCHQRQASMDLWAARYGRLGRVVCLY